MLHSDSVAGLPSLAEGQRWHVEIMYDRPIIRLQERRWKMGIFPYWFEHGSDWVIRPFDEAMYDLDHVRSRTVEVARKLKAEYDKTQQRREHAEAVRQLFEGGAA